MVNRSSFLTLIVGAMALFMSNVVHGQSNQDTDDSSSPFKVQFSNRTSKTDHPALVGFTVDGTLEKFGHIAGDGTFNYDAEKSFGGGFNIGQTDAKDTSKAIAGIGGGYSFNQTNVNVGAGISAFDQKTNFNLNIAKGGVVSISFDLGGTSAKSLNCKPTNVNGTKGMTCTTATSK